MVLSLEKRESQSHLKMEEIYREGAKDGKEVMILGFKNVKNFKLFFASLASGSKMLVPACPGYG
ncbi:MAG TPA: hypothetical protein VLG39_06455 [Nitrospirota bacterium]|nr:hypothetical protein [Nitrospirota bacterium]